MCISLSLYIYIYIYIYICIHPATRLGSLGPKAGSLNSYQTTGTGTCEHLKSTFRQHV